MGVEAPDGSKWFKNTGTFYDTFDTVTQLIAYTKRKKNSTASLNWRIRNSSGSIACTTITRCIRRDESHDAERRSG